MDQPGIKNKTLRAQTLAVLLAPLVELTRRAGRDAQALSFTLWAPLNDNAAAEAVASATSRARFRMSGAFEFNSDRVSSQSRTGNLIRLEGTGR